MPDASLLQHFNFGEMNFIWIFFTGPLGMTSTSSNAFWLSRQTAVPSMTSTSLCILPKQTSADSRGCTFKMYLQDCLDRLAAHCHNEFSERYSFVLARWILQTQFLREKNNCAWCMQVCQSTLWRLWGKQSSGEMLLPIAARWWVRRG